MVNVFAGPVQVTPPITYSGVTVMVPTIGAAVLLVAVNEGILPEPLAAKPMAVLLFVQLNVLAAPVKLTAAVEAPLHTTWFEGWSTEGVGLTVMVKVIASPVQFTLLGVTVIVATIGALPLLIATNEPISPLPLAARPIPG
jgi:hypothetical protein